MRQCAFFTVCTQPRFFLLLSSFSMHNFFTSLSYALICSVLLHKGISVFCNCTYVYNEIKLKKAHAKTVLVLALFHINKCFIYTYIA